MTSRDPRMCCEAVRLAILAAAWLLVDFALVLTEVQVITQLLAEIRLLGFSSHRILRSLPKYCDDGSLPVQMSERTFLHRAVNQFC